ncbi:MAG: hypothetical protein J6S89_09405 [Paludibacteraceae bacterium]|nr:hypothetical protein [Paludibacteraceae bacterium]
MIHFWLQRFNKPVAFYAYTSRVISPINEIDESHATEDEKEIMDYINDLLSRAAKLKRKNSFCSTREDNKTVIELSDGKHSIFLGRYDWKYWIGLDVRSDFDECKIDLSDVSVYQWSKLKTSEK